VIAAGLDGIERRLTLPPPVTVDPHTLSEDERKQIGADRLPTSLKEAIAHLRRDEALLKAMGERLATSYIAVKELDIEAFAAADDSFEFRQHIYKY
jgi:glutamine synthetase